MYGSRAPSRGPLAYSVGRPAGAVVKSALFFFSREFETENSKSSENISSKFETKEKGMYNVVARWKDGSREEVIESFMDLDVAESEACLFILEAKRKVSIVVVEVEEGEENASD